MADGSSAASPPDDPVFIDPTALRCPRLREDIVARPRLVERVLGSPARLVLITGPAGAGKSVLLAQCHAECDHPAWLSIVSADNDPVVLWTSLLTTLDRYLGLRAVEVRRRLTAAGPAVLDRVVTDVIEALEDGGVALDLFVDDLHLLEDDRSRESLYRFVRYLPAGVRVVAASRSRAPLPVARLRAEGELEEILGSELAFTEAETHQVAGGVAVPLPEPVIERLMEHTEGWPAGVRLATMAAETADGLAEALASFRGSDRTVADYLAAEVLEDLPPPDRRFLEETSILERLRGDLCDAVTASTGGADRLAALERANAFVIPLDESGDWFRYHHLFAELLQARLARRSNSEIRELHDRAFGYLRRAGDVVEAVRHGLAAGRETEAADPVCAHWLGLVSTGRLATARRLVADFDRDQVLGYPPLAVAAAHLAGLAGARHEARVYLEAAELADYAGPAADGMATMEGSLAMVRGSLALDGVDRALADATLAHAGEPPTSPWRPLAALVIGLAMVMRGDDKEAVGFLEEAAVTEDAGVRSYALAELALAYLARDGLGRARTLADEACELVADAGLEDVIQSASAHAARARVAVAAGDRSLARRELDAAEPPLTLTADSLPMDAMRTALLLGEVALALDLPDRAQQHLDTVTRLGRVTPDPGAMGDRLTELRAGLPESPRPVQNHAHEAELTEREREIIALLPLDLTIREVGEELFLSRNTIKTYLRRIYRKLGVSTREDAVARARVLGLMG